MMVGRGSYPTGLTKLPAATLKPRHSGDYGQYEDEHTLGPCFLHAVIFMASMALMADADSCIIRTVY